MGTVGTAPIIVTAIDAPSGIQFVPASLVVGTGDDVLVRPVWKNDGGTPDRIVLVTVLSTSTIAVITYSLHQNSWVFDPAVDARDSSITLNVTAASQLNINAFAVESPGTASDPILFISTNNASQTPDTFEMDSIQLADGATSLTATAVTIAGANQPADTDNMSATSLALSVSRVMTFFQDDAHFADVTGDEGGFTFTYTDAKVLAVDTSISGDQALSGFLIGSQVILFAGGTTVTSIAMWEITPAAVLTEEFNPFVAGLSGTTQDAGQEHHSAISAIGGQFAVAGPVGGGTSSGSESAFIIAAFPLDDI